MSQKPLTPQDVQRMALTLDVLKRQANELGGQLEMMENYIAGMNVTKTTIDQLKQVSPGQEIILPIGNSAFIEAKITDPSKILMAVSRDVVIQKSVENADAYANKMLKIYNESQEKLSTRLDQIVGQINQIQPQLEAIMRQAQQMSAGAGFGGNNAE